MKAFAESHWPEPYPGCHHTNTLYDGFGLLSTGCTLVASVLIEHYALSKLATHVQYNLYLYDQKNTNIIAEVMEI